MSRLKSLFVTVGVVAFLSGCVTGTPFQEAGSLIPEIKAGQGRIFVYRHLGVFSAIARRALYVDGKPVADVLAGKSSFIDTKPGKHVVNSNDRRARMTIDVPEGRTIYLRFEIVRDDVAEGNTLIHIVPEKIAKKDIKSSNLIETMIRHPDEL